MFVRWERVKVQLFVFEGARFSCLSVGCEV